MQHTASRDSCIASTQLAKCTDISFIKWTTRRVDDLRTTHFANSKSLKTAFQASIKCLLFCQIFLQIDQSENSPRVDQFQQSMN